MALCLAIRRPVGAGLRSECSGHLSYVGGSPRILPAGRSARSAAQWLDAVGIAALLKPSASGGTMLNGVILPIGTRGASSLGGSTRWDQW